MKDINDVRQYFDDIVSGVRRPFSLVDNAAAFACLQPYDQILKACGLICDTPYESLKTALTTSPADASKIQLYKDVQRILKIPFDT